METKTFKGTVASAYGKTLDTPISFEFEVKQFTSADEVREAGEWPKDSEVVDFVNARNKNNERQKAQNAALSAAGIERPDLASDVQLQLRTLIKVYEAAGKSKDEARGLAESTLGAKLEG